MAVHWGGRWTSNLEVQSLVILQSCSDPRQVIHTLVSGHQPAYIGVPAKGGDALKLGR